MRSKTLLLGGLSLFAATALACSNPSADDSEVAGGGAITSNDAQIVDFAFDGEVLTAKDEETRKAITAQLFYTIGPLTHQAEANGQVGRVELSSTETIEGSTKRIKYSAKLPVAWPKGKAVPTSYTFSLPHDVRKVDAFNDKYDGSCGTNEYGRENFWHDWNPLASGCKVDKADVFASPVRITPNATVTTGKYPEYAKVWEDGSLQVVALFGYSDSGGPSDFGEHEYEEFIKRAKGVVPSSTLTTNAVTTSIHKDVTIKGKARVQGVDRDVSITAILIGTLFEAGPDFDTRYDALSEKADLVVYNGHSELSKNTNALARKGKVTPKQYQLFFFDSCDTYAYLDTKLADRRHEVNGADDPNGTKYLDIATNVLPSFFNNYAASSLSFVSALIKRDTPKSYNEIMTELPSDQVVVVSGEEDNAFRP